MRNSNPSTIFPLKDLTVLDEVRKVFHETTGLGLSFHYPGDGCYDFYPQNEKNSYCQVIQSTPEGLARCLRSDSTALCDARKKGKYCIYTCHAGLVNAVIPLIFKGREIAAIFTGQVFTKPQGKEDFLEIYKELHPLGIPQDRIYKEFFQVKVFDMDKLLLGIKLIDFMSNYIISVEDEMYLQSELYRKEQEILKYENEQIRLKNDLQNLSILVLRDKVDFRSDVSGISPHNQQKLAIVARAQEFIRKNYNLGLTLSDVSGAVYLSPNYFSTIFKEITNTNFSNYLNSIRIQEGKKLLRETNLPIKQIVQMVGFEDYNYFNRVFKKSVNLPPATYREMFGRKDF
ncbi:MAG: PocR ligand-binding domain-containing protein [Sphaerochaeta sp.]|nr:PocR ligand-binding domain-containing protein [Sphaerochaeta sp.]